MILPTSRSYSTQLDVGPRAVLTVTDREELLLESEVRTPGERECDGGWGTCVTAGRERDAEVDIEVVGVVILGCEVDGSSLPAGGDPAPDED